MGHYRYTVILEREEDGGFHAFVPALKGCHTEGNTEEEALANAQGAISVCIESLKAHGEPVPGEGSLASRYFLNGDDFFL
jgi:predicted RNase H-like HicB family nuclease